MKPLMNTFDPGQSQHRKAHAASYAKPHVDLDSLPDHRRRHSSSHPQIWGGGDHSPRRTPNAVPYARY